MPKIPSPVRDAESWLVLQEIDQRGNGLSPWEVQFIEDITKRLLAGRELSLAQRVKLAAIHEERVS